MAKGHLGRLEKFLVQFQSHFKIPNSKAFEIFNAFIRGLYLAAKSNCESISKELDYNSQTINHFISNSPWQWEDIPTKIGELFVSLLPKSWHTDLCLVIDDSGHPKKGTSSIGASHQYCGQLGKMANCQVGVYSGLICRGFYCLLQALLYLPESCCNDKSKELPKERKVHLTKIAIAYAMIEKVITLQIPIKWISFDSFYGRDQSLLSKIHTKGLEFVVSIPKNARIYTNEPKLYLPENKRLNGKPCIKYKIKGKSTTPEKLVKSLASKLFRETSIRPGSNGKMIKAKCYTKTVFIADLDTHQIIETKLLIKKDGNGTNYILTNDLQSSTKRIAFKYSQRYFIERSFQELKQHIGMNDYQIRGYNGWHKHMITCMISLLFIQQEKMIYHKIDVKLSSPQLVEILFHQLPSKPKTIEDLFDYFDTCNSKHADAFD